MENLAEKYPQQISLIEFGKSYEGRNMTGIKLNIGGGRKKAIIIEGMFHAREWISGATITWILNELLTSPNPEVQKIAESYEWHIFPVMNPDGYEYSWTTDRFQRKNRRVFDKSLNTTCVGVDLNRNFDDHFEVVNSHCEAVYGGPKPFSEPETFYFAKYLTNLKTKIFAYYSIHAFSEL
jgi:murein tripeptide amidase MpaA